MGARVWSARVLLFASAAVVLWAVVALGMAEHYLTTDQADKALAWYPHPGLEARDGKDTASIEALVANPADARALFRLARLWEDAGETRRAAEAVRLAEQLAPADAALHLAAAAYYVDRGAVDAALDRWNKALVIKPHLQHQLFPALLALAEDADSALVFRRVAESDPVWWPDFFAHAAQRARHWQTAARLFALRVEAGTVMPDERALYIARLQNAGQWSQAYLAWLSGLDGAQRRYLAPVYDGGFETPLGETGFGWQVSDSDRVDVVAAPVPGGSGRALRVAFKGQRVRFQHLQQPLLLAPGAYALQGRVMPQALEANRGLQWEVSCAGQPERVLGRSERFVGTGDWRYFRFRVRVPGDACEAQTLRLVAVAEHWADYRLAGEIFFDDLEVVREGTAQR